MSVETQYTTLPDEEVGGRCGAPVFIIGALNRSGTNYLADILLQYPDFEMPKITEDYLLEHAQLLEEYTRRTAHRWDRKLGDGSSELAMKCLGDGLSAFLRTGCTRDDSRLLLKTPRAYGMSRLWNFFPDAKMVIIVRDGRDTVESAANSFTFFNHRDWMKEWKIGARIVLDFISCSHSAKEGESWVLVKYEDLVEAPRETIPHILEFLEIPVDAYDWEKFESLPVRGSSTVRGADGGLTWEPIEKPRSFKPIGKWQHWSWWRKQQFKRIAGRELINLGYEQDHSW